MIEKLGSKFLTKNLEEKNESILNNVSVVALYFFASWSKHCIAFTPKLIDFYNNVNKNSENGKALEIVALNFDPDENKFKDSIKDMPWLILPFKDSQRIKIYQEFKEDLKGIPAVLVMKNDGNIIIKNGRGEVQLKGVNCFENWLKLCVN